MVKTMLPSNTFAGTEWDLWHDHLAEGKMFKIEVLVWVKSFFFFFFFLQEKRAQAERERDLRIAEGEKDSANSDRTKEKQALEAKLSALGLRVVEVSYILRYTHAHTHTRAHARTHMHACTRREFRSFPNLILHSHLIRCFANVMQGCEMWCGSAQTHHIHHSRWNIKINVFFFLSSVFVSAFVTGEARIHSRLSGMAAGPATYIPSPAFVAVQCFVFAYFFFVCSGRVGRSLVSVGVHCFFFPVSLQAL